MIGRFVHMCPDNKYKLKSKEMKRIIPSAVSTQLTAIGIFSGTLLTVASEDSLRWCI